MSAIVPRLKREVTETQTINKVMVECVCLRMYTTPYTTSLLHFVLKLICRFLLLRPTLLRYIFVWSRFSLPSSDGRILCIFSLQPLRWITGSCISINMIFWIHCIKLKKVNQNCIYFMRNTCIEKVVWRGMGYRWRWCGENEECDDSECMDEKKNELINEKSKSDILESWNGNNKL